MCFPSNGSGNWAGSGQLNWYCTTEASPSCRSEYKRPESFHTRLIPQSVTCSCWGERCKNPLKFLYSDFSKKNIVSVITRFQNWFPCVPNLVLIRERRWSTRSNVQNLIDETIDSGICRWFWCNSLPSVPQSVTTLVVLSYARVVILL